MNAAPARRQDTRRCPQCGQPLTRRIPDVHKKGCGAAPVKQYALEPMFGIKRMNGGFV